MHRSLLLCVLILLAATGSLLVAEEPFISQNTRLQSLGGVYSSLPDNIELLALNPAALEFVEDSKLTLFSFMLDFNGDAFSTVSDFMDAYGNVETTQDFSPAQIKQLQQHDPHLRLSGPFEISYVKKYWGISLVNVNARLRPRFLYSAGRSAVRLDGRGDTAFTFAYGRRVYKRLSAGLSLRYQVRAELIDTDVSETTEDDLLFLRRGLGYDLGLLYPLQRWPIYVGLTYHDMFNTNLSEKKIRLDGEDSTDGKTKKVSQQLRLGATYRPDFKIPYGWLAYYPVHTLLSLEFGGGDSFWDRLHIGTEVQLFRWLALRMGINGGIRLGLGLGIQSFSFDYMFASRLEDYDGVHSATILWRY